MTSLDALPNGVVDDWESVGDEQVQKLANQRKAQVREQQKNAAEEDKCLTAEGQSSLQNTQIPAKPLRLLKRVKMTAEEIRIAEAEKEALKEMNTLSLDERIANYDKIRERIFNSTAPAEKEKPKELSKNMKTAKPLELGNYSQNSGQPSPTGDVQVEPINHLTYVQMLSDDVPKGPPQGIPMHKPNEPSMMQPPPLHGMMLPYGHQMPSAGQAPVAPPHMLGAHHFPPPSWLRSPLDLNQAPGVLPPYGHPSPIGQGMFPTQSVAPPPNTLSSNVAAHPGTPWIGHSVIATSQPGRPSNRANAAQPVPLMSIRTQPPPPTQRRTVPPPMPNNKWVRPSNVSAQAHAQQQPQQRHRTGLQISLTTEWEMLHGVLGRKCCYATK